MKVLILNAGSGIRLKPLTEKYPKCLITITEDDTILDLQLKSMIRNGLNNIIMLLGPFEKEMKEFIQKGYPDLNVEYVHNPIYEKTNYIYSIYLLKDFSLDDILLIHGDLVYSDNLIKNLLNSDITNCVFVNKDILPPEKDFKAFIENNKIIKIGVNISGPNSAFLAPIYKISKQFFRRWLDQIEKFVAENKTNCYAEDALNEILNDLDLKPFYFNDPLCMEIDDFEDLEKARALFKKKQ